MSQVMGQHRRPGQTYAQTLILAPDSNVRKTAKPLFIKEFDIFGSAKPPQEQWLNHTEIYKSISQSIAPETIAGIQRVRGLWRIYMDNDDSRATLLTSTFSLRGKTMTIYGSNPGSPYNDDNIRIRVRNVPLSADDGQIKRALTLRGCDIKILFREKLRVDGRLTNCETGDRIAIVTKMDTHLPKSIEIGRYRATINYKGQTDGKSQQCKRCLRTGHPTRECPNDIVCLECHDTGHMMSECPDQLDNDQLETESDADSEGTCTGEESDTVDEDHQPASRDVGNQQQRLDKPNTIQSSSGCEKTSCKGSEENTMAGSDNSKVKKKKSKKQHKSASASVGTLDKYLQSTPGGSSKTGVVHSPPTSSEVVAARERASKKSKDGT
ncbi:hypothetical protein FSP39_013744 [Pinctada imbricata]|uniref:CCHC-type domain-containing protein n=1 Tax=Pinctada imbricata TaxID=66713 RepID=A0AA89C3E3_PINIB|nr:hypothetical protein FSP39_013744 [Pinctada imbricata]